MDVDTNNKVVVVTGGADGIGFGIAEAFLKENAKHVIIVDLNETKGNDAANKLNEKYGQEKAEFINADVNKDLNEVSTTIFKKYKTVDCLVNNAAILDEFYPRKAIEINTISFIEWTLKFLDHMRKDNSGKGGTIINIGSLYSYLVDPYLPVYKAAKFAVMGFSRTLGHEQNYKLYGVRVIVVCPGRTYTNMALTINTSILWEEQAKIFQEFCDTLPCQTPEDLGKAAVKIFNTAESGTAWSIISGNIEQVP